MLTMCIYIFIVLCQFNLFDLVLFNFFNKNIFIIIINMSFYSSADVSTKYIDPKSLLMERERFLI